MAIPLVMVLVTKLVMALGVELVTVLEMMLELTTVPSWLAFATVVVMVL